MMLLGPMNAVNSDKNQVKNGKPNKKMIVIYIIGYLNKFFFILTATKH